MMKKFAVALALLIVTSAGAFPNFSGTCLAGPDLMPQGTEHFGGNQGSLADAGYGARIAGVASLDDSANDSVLELQANQPYGLSIEAATGAADAPALFWGYFFRVSSPGDGVSRAGSIGIPADDSGALQLLDSDGAGATRTDNDDERPAACAAAVAGASHVSVDTGRDQITAILDVREPGEIVVEVVLMMSEQEWYYSSYTVTVVIAEEMAPTTDTTSSVVSPSPAPDGTLNNNEETTPTATTSSNNANAPVAAPTDTSVAAAPDATLNNNAETPTTSDANNDATTSAAAMEYHYRHATTTVLSILIVAIGFTT